MYQLLFLWFACTEKAKPLVVYSGRSEKLVGQLLKDAATDLGFKIEVQYGKTPDIVNRIMVEGEQSMADVVFAQDSGHLGALADQNLLQPLEEDLRSGIDQAFQDEKGRWLGTSGRLRVLVYDSARLSEKDLPPTLFDLKDSKWKNRLGWAPSNGSFQSHVSALRAVWGEEKTKAWLKGLQANTPKVYPKNSPQVKAANEGKLEIGWVNHYYLHKVASPEGRAKNYSFPTENDAGNVLMLAGVGIRKGSQNQSKSIQLLKWLTSEKAQMHFAEHNYEYPTKPGIQTHSDVPALNPSLLAPVTQESLSDLGPTRQMLKDLGIQ